MAIVFDEVTARVEQEQVDPSEESAPGPAPSGPSGQDPGELRRLMRRMDYRHSRLCAD